jgi:hypothetical protein
MPEYLNSVGYGMLPVNPLETDVLGDRRYARLEVIPERVDFLDTFAGLNSPRTYGSLQFASLLALHGCRKASGARKPPRERAVPNFSSPRTRAS